MKKTLVSALTTALVVGAASTTFAAANPFSDVPADHWAYDAVTQLAQDGVIEGYGDDTFRGDRNITRYEMAQMVAKAMAKTDVSAADKALIDKLAAEFADELNNLGVRVSNLERNADMVKWNGEARYTIMRHNHEGRADDDVDDINEALLRLEPSAEVNDHWHVNARLDVKHNFADDNGGENDDNVKLKRVWAQGDYGNFEVKLGRFATRDNDSIMDTEYSGAEVSYGSKIKGILGAGRLNTDDAFGHVVGNRDQDAANYYFAGLEYANSKFVGGVHYHNADLGDFYDDNALGDRIDSTRASFDDDTLDIWAVKAGYRFDNNNMLSGLYAKSGWDVEVANHDADDNAWFVQYDYKGVQPENAGTWGAWVAYRHLGLAASPFPTYDVIQENEKGWELGAAYAFAHNIVGSVKYARGEQIDGVNSDHDDFSSIWGRLQFFF